MHAEDGKNILLFLAQGFEDLEAVTVLTACGWTEYRPHLSDVRVTVTGFHREVKGRFGLTIKTDIPIEEVDPQDFDALVIPGGFHSHGFDEAYCAALQTLIKAMYAKGSILATMCVGVLPVAQAGLLEGKEATTYEFSRFHDNFGQLQASGCNPVHESVVVSERIISCSGPAYAQDVVMILLGHLIGTEGAQEIARYRAGITL